MFVACGINYHKTPIHIREQLALSELKRMSFIEHLTHLDSKNEATIVSTCQRTEFYCDLAEPEKLITAFADYTKVPISTIAESWYCYQEDKGIKHAIRVACGLDSMMLGETQIFGQLKDAFIEASHIGGVKNSLNKIFPFVIRTSKLIRQQCGINKFAISIASAAAQRILQDNKNPEDLRVLIIGTGEMAELVTKYLYTAGVKKFWITSRTEEHAQNLATQYQAASIPITSIYQFFTEVDVVITATACPFSFITKDMLDNLHDHSIFFLDLAMPRNVCETIGQIPRMTVCNIDSLQSQCLSNLAQRQQAAILAETMIEQELTKYFCWTDSLASKNIILDYRKHMQQLAQKELAIAMESLKQNQVCADEVLQKLTYRLVKKLTHIPTITLKQAARGGNKELLALAQSMLDEII